MIKIKMECVGEHEPLLRALEGEDKVISCQREPMTAAYVERILNGEPVHVYAFVRNEKDRLYIAMRYGNVRKE